MDDETIGDLTKEDLLDFGFLKGDAIKFLKAFAEAAAPSAASVRSISTRAADTSASCSFTLTHSIDAAI